MFLVIGYFLSLSFDILCMCKCKQTDNVERFAHCVSQLVYRLFLIFCLLTKIINNKRATKNTYNKGDKLHIIYM